MVSEQPNSSSQKNWIEYWNEDELWTYSKLWEVNAKLFIKKADPYISFSKEDTVLDIGCGSGFIAHALSPRVKTVVAADTSTRNLRLCELRCKDTANVVTAEIPSDYTQIHSLGKFSLFLCNSVVQYYQRPQQLEQLIASAQLAALPQARMLISDIPIHRHFLQKGWDAAASLTQSFWEGYGVEYLSMAKNLICSNSIYKDFSKNHSILFYDATFLETLPQRLQLKGKLIRKSLSLCAHRPSLLIQFP